MVVSVPVRPTFPLINLRIAVDVNEVTILAQQA
jgi:hypothetical protein